MGAQARSPEFRILGPLEVDGGASLGGPRQRALLARLLLSADESVPSSSLIDAVWGERTPAGAGRSLEVYASRLRKAIAPTGAQIVRRGNGYALLLGPARVDVAEFEARADAGRRALAAGAAAEAWAHLADALALWRGPALPDLEEDLSLHLEESRLAAAEDLADAELALGRHGEVVPELERRVREQPLRERSRAQLMLALYRSGRQADALETYRDIRRSLDQLGLEPGRELRELEVAILRQDSSLAVESSDVQRRRSIALNNVAVIHYEGRRWDEARLAYRESLAVAREVGSKELGAFAQYGLGAVALFVDELDEAERELVGGLALFHELGFPDRVASCCTYLAALARARGDDAGAARLLGAAAGWRGSSEATTDRLEYERGEQARAEVEEALGKRAFTAAFEAGLTAPERVVREVLGTPTSTLTK